jgi:hypothetical protein
MVMFGGPQRPVAHEASHSREQGRRHPSGAAVTLLKIIARHPKVLREVATRGWTARSDSSHFDTLDFARADGFEPPTIWFDVTRYPFFIHHSLPICLEPTKKSSWGA